MAQNLRNSLLVGTETLSEVQSLIKELQQVEADMQRGAGCSGSAVINYEIRIYSPEHVAKNCVDELNDNDLSALLTESELLDITPLTCGEEDYSRLALPTTNEGSKKEYPSDFENWDHHDRSLKQIQFRLLFQIKESIKEDLLMSTAMAQPASTAQSPQRVPVSPNKPSLGSGTYRKKSYTISVINPSETINPVSQTVDPMLALANSTTVAGMTGGVPVIIPAIITSNTHPLYVKPPISSYATYSKKTSPHLGINPRTIPHAIFPVYRPPTPERNDSEMERERRRTSRPIPSEHNGTEPYHNEKTISKRMPTRTTTDISLEELQTLARAQQEAALDSGRTLNRNMAQGISLNNSFDDEDYSGSSGNRTWSNDTYSVGEHSSPRSETSSGISSPPPAGSLEDVQMSNDSIRRSLPNLTQRLAVAHSARQFQRNARIRSDEKLTNQGVSLMTSGIPTMSEGFHTQFGASKISSAYETMTLAHNTQANGVYPNSPNATFTRPSVTRKDTFDLGNSGDRIELKRRATFVKPAPPSRIPGRCPMIAVSGIPRFCPVADENVPRRYEGGMYQAGTQGRHIPSPKTFGTAGTVQNPNPNRRASAPHKPLGAQRQ